MFVLVSYVFSIKYVEAIKIYASLKAIPKQLSHLKKKAAFLVQVYVTGKKEINLENVWHLQYMCLIGVCKPISRVLGSVRFLRYTSRHPFVLRKVKSGNVSLLVFSVQPIAQHFINQKEVVLSMPPVWAYRILSTEPSDSG